MDDVISRQKALNVIKRMRAYIGHNMERAVGAAFIEILDDVGKDIGRLPSAQPTFDARDTQYNLPIGTDLISRAQAIAMCRKPRMRNADCSDFEMEIMMLPSAQPEIIVCEDCKWRMRENRKTTSLWLPCRALVTPDEFSCIYAERREVTT